MRNIWKSQVFDEDGNPLTPASGKSWLPKFSFDADKFADAVVILAIVAVSAPAGWFSHAIFAQPDYSELTNGLKKKGFSILAQTIDETTHICPTGPGRMERACDLLWTAQDLQAKSPSEEGQKVAQVVMNVPGD